MENLIYLFALITFISTLIGGAIILKFKGSLPYFFAFAAGSLISVAFLDILPESLSVAESVQIPLRNIMLTVVASFFVYSLLEKYFLTHNLDDHQDHGHSHGHIMGPIGASSLILHSFLDGVAIGIAFQVGSSVGMVVALAVIFHDLTDGVNTVVVMLKNKQSQSRAFRFLLLDALAPALGILLTSLVSIPASVLAYLLAIFVGEFIYIGAANLLPETHAYNAKKVLAAMAFGIILIAVLTSFIA